MNNVLKQALIFFLEEKEGQKHFWKIENFMFFLFLKAICVLVSNFILLLSQALKAH